MEASESHLVYEKGSLKKHLFKGGETELTVTIDQLPQTAGIDPLYKLIGKTPDDNIVVITETM